MEHQAESLGYHCVIVDFGSVDPRQVSLLLQDFVCWLISTADNKNICLSSAVWLTWQCQAILILFEGRCFTPQSPQHSSDLDE